MRHFLCIITGLMLLTAAGCVAGKTPALPGSAAVSVAEYREKALTFEKQGDVQQALFWWKVIHALQPEDVEVQAKVASLQALARQKAEEHYEKAQSLAGKGDLESARRQAVIALRYDPDHSEALDLINQDKGMLSHRVQAGETLSVIAEKYFNDPAKASVIAYFNDLPEVSTQLSPGMLLEFPRLPVSEVARQEPVVPETDAMLAEARKEFNEKKYRQAAVLAEKIIRLNPDEQKAQLLLDNSYLSIGRDHLRRKEYTKAEKVLMKISKDFPGLGQAMTELTQWKKEQAEEHYRQGVKHYLNEDLSKAIAEWQEALEIYPDHIRARENIEKTRAILEKLKAVK